MNPDRGAGGEGAARLPPYLRHAFGDFAAAPLPAPPTGSVEETLRPFVLTSGRVSAVDQGIELETQVTSNYDAGTARYATADLPSELRAIVLLCDVPMSVAEISARLRLHLGVARILVGDLRAAGHLEIHHVDMSENHSPDVIMRVIRGLRAIQ